MRFTVKKAGETVFAVGGLAGIALGVCLWFLTVLASMLLPILLVALIIKFLFF